MPRNPNKRRCAYPGCQGWAMAESRYCRVHRTMLEDRAEKRDDSPLGIYAAVLTPEEQLLLEQSGDQLDLEPEIWLLRIMSRRLFVAIGQDGTDREALRKLASVLYQGIARLAHLLRVRRALRGEAADGLAGALAKALDEIDLLVDGNGGQDDD